MLMPYFAKDFLVIGLPFKKNYFSKNIEIVNKTSRLFRKQPTFKKDGVSKNIEIVELDKTFFSSAPPFKKNRLPENTSET